MILDDATTPKEAIESCEDHKRSVTLVNVAPAHKFMPGQSSLGWCSLSQCNISLELLMGILEGHSGIVFDGTQDAVSDAWFVLCANLKNFGRNKNYM